MSAESIVYGCIKDMVMSNNPDESRRHRQNNREVMMKLPSIEEWPLLAREMFAMPVRLAGEDHVQTDIVHFGSSYKAVEYEWQQWLSAFEDILKRMYWVSAVVHLETAFNGRHTFVWESDSGLHEPDKGQMSVRCEWSHEASAL